MDKLRVFTAFSGYDSQCMALDRLKRYFPTFDYELVGWAEIDKYAIQAHNALYPQWADRNYGDISKIDWDEVPDFDLFTYSSPCQDFSNAGLRKGGEEGSGTRSSLLWECRRAIIAKKPKYLLLENVASLVNKRFLPLFNKWQAELESYGYTNFAKVLNAKDYGVPQNRERVFLVSILDVDARYSFPPAMPLDKRLKDILEQNVDEKYYLSDLSINRMQRNMGKEDISIDTEGVRKTICASLNKITTFDNYIKDALGVIEYQDMNNQTICINSKVNGKQPSLQDRVYSIDGCSTAITTGFHPSIAEPIRIKQDAAPSLRDTDYKDPHCIWETVVGSKQANSFLGDVNGEAPCITSACGAGGGMTPMVTNVTLKEANTDEFREQVRGHRPLQYLIRKFTPRECFRLMGVTETDIDKIQQAGISNTRQYQLAGNSIVIDVLVQIFRKMFTETHSEDRQLTLF